MPAIKPKIEDLQKGILFCQSCNAELLLGKYSALEVTLCPSCNAPHFIPIKIKHYWLYHPLGGGGMGCVYKALSEIKSGDFAIKILPRSKKDDPYLIQTLMREGKIGTILGKFPHIIEVLEYGREGDEPYMVSRFAKGTRLDVFISAAKKLSERQALDIIKQVLDAEIHIKNCGYIYRDIKPENIILTEEKIMVKLLDFGLCIPLDQAANPDPNENLEGSPFYLPPERIVAAPEGEYSEVYSLGMLLFHMLSGTTYFSKADVKNLLTKHIRSRRVNSVKPRLKQCSQEVIDLIDKMIEKDPNMRYHTLAELSYDIEKISEKVAGYSLASPLEQTTHLQPISISSKKEPQHFIELKFAIIITLLIVSTLLWYYGNKINEQNKMMELIAQTAAELHIPANIQPPSLTRNEVERAIAKEIANQIATESSKLPHFNAEAAKKEIAKEQSIDLNTINRIYPPLSDIRKQVKQACLKEIDAHLKKHTMVFDQKKAEKEIADTLHITLPLKGIESNEDTIKGITNSEEKIFQQKLQEKREKFEQDKLTMEENIISEVKKNFNEDKFYINAGYRKFNGKWITEKELINKLLAKKKNAFQLQHLKQLETLENKIRSNVEQQTYRENGYIFHNGKWCAAKKLLDETVQQRKIKYK